MSNNRQVIEELYRFIDTENKSLMVLLSRIVEILTQEGDFSNPTARDLMIMSLEQKSANLHTALNELLNLIKSETQGVYEENTYEET